MMTFQEGDSFFKEFHKHKDETEFLNHSRVKGTVNLLLMLFVHLDILGVSCQVLEISVVEMPAFSQM